MMNTLLALFALVYVAHATVTLKRTISNVNGVVPYVKITPGCTSADQYGSNDCTMNWGQTYTINETVALQKEVTGTSKLSVQATVAGIIPLAFECPMCGANCTVTIPIINKKESWYMGPCPIKAATENKVIPLPLPASNPIGIPVSITGTVTISGDISITIGLEASLSSENLHEHFATLMEPYIFLGRRRY